MNIKVNAASERSLAEATDKALALHRRYGYRYRVVQTPSGYLYIIRADSRVSFKGDLIVHFDTGGGAIS